mmetsp:Transcript_988/g.1494  ORF Transcript_988/g.1494 Transcript_988/m.1494 type:complete len:87 (-) Transcript_988:1548-1808(-)
MISPAPAVAPMGYHMTPAQPWQEVFVHHPMAHQPHFQHVHAPYHMAPHGHHMAPMQCISHQPQPQGAAEPAEAESAHEEATDETTA